MKTVEWVRDAARFPMDGGVLRYLLCAAVLALVLGLPFYILTRMLP